MSETVALGAWATDLDPKAGFENLVQAENFRPVDGKYDPCPTLFETSATVPAGTPRALFSARDSDGTAKTFLFTTTKIYRLDSSTLTDVTNAGGNYTTAAGQTWDFTIAGGTDLIACNFNDTTQRLTDITSGGNFIDLITAPPKATSCASYRGHLFMLNTSESATEYPRRLRRSAQQTLGGIEVWGEDPDVGSGYKDLESEDERGICIRTLGDSLLAFMTESCWRVKLVGPPIWFSYRNIAEKVPGPVGIHAVVSVDRNNILYLGKDDVYAVTQEGIEPLDTNIKSYIRNIDPDNRFKVTHTIDKSRQLIQWTFINSGAASPDEILLFNYKEGRFTRSTQATFALGAVRTPGYTVDGLDAVSATIDGLPDAGGIDSFFYNGGADVDGYIDTDSLLKTATGANYLDGKMETGELDTDAFGTVNRIRPIIEQPENAVVCKVGKRNNDFATPSEVSANTNADGNASLRATGRLFKFKFETTGNHGGFRGFKYDLRPRGKQGAF